MVELDLPTIPLQSRRLGACVRDRQHQESACNEGDLCAHC